VATNADETWVRWVYFLTVRNRELMTEDLIRRHVGHLKRIEDDGCLELCGPFGDRTGGMVMLRGMTEVEARAAAEADPFVSSGAETYELRQLTLSCRENGHLGMG